MGELHWVAAAVSSLGSAVAGLAVARCARRCFEVELRRWVVCVACMAVGAALGLRVGASAWLAPLLALGWTGVAVSGIDLRTHLIPTRLLWAVSLAAAGLFGVAVALEASSQAGMQIGLAVPPAWRTLAAALLGGVAGWATMHLVWSLARGGLGYGDVRLGGYLGMHLGLVGGLSVGPGAGLIGNLGGVGLVLWGLLAGFAIAAAVGLIAVLALGRGTDHRFAMGPSLVAGALAVIWWNAPAGLAA